MKILTPKSAVNGNDSDFVKETLAIANTKKVFVEIIKQRLSKADKSDFYPNVCILFNYIGYKKARAIREGDVNCRFDAIIIDDERSIPIEIKSPREDMEINVKAIRQAFENKIVLLSRKFYPTTNDTTSLSVAFVYPPVRSDVFELVDDINKSSGFNIGMIDIGDLAKLTYDVVVNKRKINWNYLNTFRGCLDYESSFA